MDTVVMARAPVCINLVGDLGTLADHYERAGGPVLYAAAGYYVYAVLTSSDLGGVQITFEGHQSFATGSDRGRRRANSGLGLLEAIAHYFDAADGQRVFVASQIPVGMGATLRGSLAVAMIKVLAFRCGLDLEPRAVAELACYIENDKLGMQVGKQAAYAAALGGQGSISFCADDVRVEPLRISSDVKGALEKQLMLFSTGDTRPSQVALQSAEQPTRRKGSVDRGLLERLAEISLGIRAELESGNLEAFGHMLHHGWLERGLLKDPDPSVERCYQAAREAGALGGSTTDGHGNGFLVMYCPLERQQAVTGVLEAHGLQRWPLVLDHQGVQAMQVVPWSRPDVMSTAPWLQSRVSEHTPSAANGRA